VSRARYPLLFIVAVVLLTGATLIAYGRIGAAAAARGMTKAGRWPGDSTPEHPPLVIPTKADYERYAAADAAWREQNARQYTVVELAARGDGRRSERDMLNDRVFLLRRRGENQRAVSELEHWVARHPRDRAALLSLARLLKETGRTDASVARYRQILSLGGE
jgi:hypothetical protein